MTVKNQLAALAKTAKKKTDQPAQDRPTVNVPGEALESFRRFAGAKSIMDLAESRKDAESEFLYEIMLDAFANTIFKHGYVPPNPRLQVDRDGKPDMSGIFQVQGRYKVNIPLEVDGDTEVETRMVAALTQAGLPLEKAKKFFENEIDASPVVMLRPFSELVNGRYVDKVFVDASEAERKAGEKLLAFTLGQSAEPLTDEERDLVVRTEENIKVKNYLQRIRVYCDTINEVKAVLAVLTPIHYVSHIKIGISDTPEQANRRLVSEAASLLGTDATELAFIDSIAA